MALGVTVSPWPQFPLRRAQAALEGGGRGGFFSPGSWEVPALALPGVELQQLVFGVQQRAAPS